MCMGGVYVMGEVHVCMGVCVCIGEVYEVHLCVWGIGSRVCLYG